jgi:hypothetical protein
MDICLYVYIDHCVMYHCVYVPTFICAYVYMCLRIYVPTYICAYVYMCLRIGYASVSVYMYLCVNISIYGPMSMSI